MSRRRFPVGDILWQWHQWRLIEHGFQIRLASVIRDNHVRRRTLIFISAHTSYQCWLCYLYRKLFIRTKLVVRCCDVTRRCDTLKKCARRRSADTDLKTMLYQMSLMQWADDGLERRIWSARVNVYTPASHVPSPPHTTYVSEGNRIQTVPISQN